MVADTRKTLPRAWANSLPAWQAPPGHCPSRLLASHESAHTPTYAHTLLPSDRPLLGNASQQPTSGPSIVTHCTLPLIWLHRALARSALANIPIKLHTLSLPSSIYTLSLLFLLLSSTSFPLPPFLFSDSRIRNQTSPNRQKTNKHLASFFFSRLLFLKRIRK